MHAYSTNWHALNNLEFNVIWCIEGKKTSRTSKYHKGVHDVFGWDLFYFYLFVLPTLFLKQSGGHVNLI